jgi:hypothetical protein
VGKQRDHIPVIAAGTTDRHCLIRIDRSDGRQPAERVRATRRLARDLSLTLTCDLYIQ